MAAIAYNIKKMMKFSINRPMAAVVSLHREFEAVMHTLIFYLRKVLSYQKVKF
ncbi:MAG: hypothetical protein KF763_20765 [Cyclobacteriaceae bacterium]|nr:hypothetical protein [Cyclobacteriaceae bacterium]